MIWGGRSVFTWHAIGTCSLHIRFILWLKTRRNDHVMKTWINILWLWQLRWICGFNLRWLQQKIGTCWLWSGSCVCPFRSEEKKRLITGQELLLTLGFPVWGPGCAAAKVAGASSSGCLLDVFGGLFTCNNSFFLRMCWISKMCRKRSWNILQEMVCTCHQLALLCWWQCWPWILSLWRRDMAKLMQREKGWVSATCFK